MDRLDYLKRDSFYTGVSEGVIGTERIIKMLTISNDALAVEEKGIYSIEKFLIARRLMYWQVYLHKTVLAAELMMHAIFKRVYFLFQNGKIELPFPLSVFWTMNIKPENLTSNTEIIDAFAQIDDNDVWIWIKQWSNHEDFVLSMLAKRFIERKLFKVEMSKSLPGEDKIKMYRKKLSLITIYQTKRLNILFFLIMLKIVHTAAQIIK
jgi:HD superfamily phosphohydrolase